MVVLHAANTPTRARTIACASPIYHRLGDGGREASLGRSPVQWETPGVGSHCTPARCLQFSSRMDGCSFGGYRPGPLYFCGSNMHCFTPAHQHYHLSQRLRPAPLLRLPPPTLFARGMAALVALYGKHPGTLGCDMLFVQKHLWMDRYVPRDVFPTPRTPAKKAGWWDYMAIPSLGLFCGSQPHGAASWISCLHMASPLAAAA